MRVPVSLWLLLAGCSSSGVPAAGDAGSPTSCNFNCQDAAVDLPLVVEMRDLLGHTCAGAECHLMGAGTLVISAEAGSEFNSLIDVPSSEMPSLLRVKPGDPIHSYAYLKVACDAGMILGACMPLGGQLTPAVVQAFHDWIEAGAPTQ